MFTLRVAEDRADILNHPNPPNTILRKTILARKIGRIKNKKFLTIAFGNQWKKADSANRIGFNEVTKMTQINNLGKTVARIDNLVSRHIDEATHERFYNRGREAGFHLGRTVSEYARTSGMSFEDACSVLKIEIPTQL